MSTISRSHSGKASYPAISSLDAASKDKLMHQQFFQNLLQCHQLSTNLPFIPPHLQSFSHPALTQSALQQNMSLGSKGSHNTVTPSNASHRSDQSSYSANSLQDDQSTPNSMHKIISGSAEEGRRKVSDAHIYGPRFVMLYEAYRSKYNLEINPSRHLMSLCIEHIIPFVNWARENDAWVSKMLLDNDYLRPEVRNGVVMVLVYTFAAIKATFAGNVDMFCSLKDHEQGLGISNRFSLKVYNDPYNYMYFLKTALSALIDAGAIPDNERQNQPKRMKLQYQNQEELVAYTAIQQMIITPLDSGNNTAARTLVSRITTYWQERGKMVRNRKFAAALQNLTNIPVTIVDSLDSSPISSTSIETVESIYSLSDPKKASAVDNTAIIENRPCRSESDITKGSTGSKRKNEAIAKTSHVPSTVALYALRFERIGLHEWDIKETRIYDINSFLRMLGIGCDVENNDSLDLELCGSCNMMCLIDEQRLVKELQDRKLLSAAKDLEGQGNMITIEKELQERKALVTSWLLSNNGTNEVAQLQSFLQNYLQHCSNSDIEIHSLENSSLYAFWKSSQIKRSSNSKKDNSTSLTMGYLMYEVNMQMILLIRKNSELGIPEDMFCSLYPADLKEVDPQICNNFGSFLESFFPQLAQLKRQKSLFQQGNSWGDIMVKYCPQKSNCSSDSSALPVIKPNPCYQTIATFATQPHKVIARLLPGPIVHDFILEVF